MRIFLFLLFFCAVAPQSGAAAFPVLKAPASYAGSIEAEGKRYTVTLILKKDHYFVIREERETSRTLTGRWFQTDGGALLQLTNRNGLDRALNVGGTGKLYAGVQAPFKKYRNVVLERIPDTAFPYTVMGTLSFDASGPLLQDAATGLVSRLAQDPRLENLREKPRFADMDVEEDGDRLSLIRLKGASETFPPLQENTPDLFRRQMLSLSWRLSADERIHCVFQENVLVVTADDMRLEIAYSLDADRITFQPDARAAELWKAFGLSDEGRLFSGTYSWDLNGNIFVLQDKQSTLCVLEKIG